MADRFTADRMAWVETALMSRHEALTPFARVVGVMIAQHLNRVTGYAYPSIVDLAALLGATEKGVRGAVRALEAAGLLVVERSAGRTLHNRYFLTGATRRQPLKDWYEERKKTPPVGAGKAGEKPHLPRQKTPPVGSEKPHRSVLYNPLIEPTDENPVCVSPTHKKAFQDDDEALAYVRELITKANVEADPRTVLQSCKSFHGDDWQKKLKGWTAGAIGRVAEKPKPIVPVYDGPAELRADVVRERGEGYATSYLDTCRWRDEDRTLLARHEFMAQRLVEDMGRGWLTRREFSVGVMAANDVPVRPVKGHLSWV